MSRIGIRPVIVPKDVKVDIKDKTVTIEGPKGKIVRVLPDRISAEFKDDKILVSRVANTKLDKSLHGLHRALLVNMVKGVTEGYVKEMEIIGTGFRAAVQGNVLNMLLGFSHPVNFNIPEGIKIETPKPTQIIIRSIDKEKIGEIAAKIRSVYPPEPYKGKGIRLVGEFVKRKVGKAQATGGK